MGSSSAVINPQGRDIQALSSYKSETGSLGGFQGADKLTPDEVLGVDCDVLVPCALGHVLTGTTAEAVQAKFVLEGANDPCTVAGDEVLRRRNIRCIPDIFANAGGVTVSYFEWAQNLQQVRGPESQVNERLDQMVTAAHGALQDTMRRHDCDMRTAAFAVAIDRVRQATELRGLA